LKALHHANALHLSIGDQEAPPGLRRLLPPVNDKGRDAGLRFVAFFLATAPEGFGRGNAVVWMKEYMQRVCNWAHP
jgi:hypothetical protein